MVPAACASVLWLANPATARTDSDEIARSVQSSARPLKLIVSIRRQRLTVWDGLRKIAEAPVSSGRSGHETPTGVFSILQKNRTHFSNLYDDAPMPFMQRLTWSGVALHAGALPGYPASHGCIRLPFSFARQLFDMTRVGARVIVASEDLQPQSVSNPKLPVPLPPADQVANANAVRVLHGGESSVDMLLGVRKADAAAARRPAYTPRRTRASVAAERAAELSAMSDAIATAQRGRDTAENGAKAAAAAVNEAQTAVSHARAGLQALSAAREAARRGQAAAGAQLATFVNRNRNDLDDATLAELGQQEDALEQRIHAAEFEIHDIDVEIAEQNHQTEALAQALSVVMTRQRVALDALAQASSALSEAQAAKFAAERAQKRQSLPISIFVSRKSGKVLVRQGFEPLFEAPVQIEHPDAPLGTHVFTALDFEAGERELSWSVVSMTTAVPSEARTRRGRDAQAQAGSARLDIPQTAAASLARVNLSDDVLERIAEFVKPGSTFMISDLDASSETGKGTDFVLLTR